MGWGWRGLYYIGALPALIAVFVFSRLKEPDRWVAAKTAAVRAQTSDQFGRISDLFTNARWRRHTLVGLGLAIAGQIGLWGVGFYTPELIDSAIPTIEKQTRPKMEAILSASSVDAHAAAVFALAEKEKRKYSNFLSRIARPGENPDAMQELNTPLTADRKEKIRGLLEKAITDDEKTQLKSIGGILQQVGAFLGISCFTALAARRGRRVSFLIALLLAWASLIWAFSTFSRPWQIWYLWPILGFCIFAPFGGYAIYFPELFPTRLRTTGTSFCYNVGRYVTAFGVFLLGPLAQAVQGLTAMPGFRLAAMIMASSYLLGIVALIWAPETVNQPLLEDEKTLAH